MNLYHIGFLSFLQGINGKEIIRWFLPGQGSQNISLRTRIKRIRVVRVLTIYPDISDKRRAGDLFQYNRSARDLSRGQWKNKRRSVRDYGSRWGPAIKRQPDSGYSVGMVLSGPVVDNVGGWISSTSHLKKSLNGFIVCSDTWKAYNVIASRRDVHRLVNHSEKQYCDGKGDHNNGREDSEDSRRENWYRKDVSYVK